MLCEKYFSSNMTRRVETKNYIVITTDKRKSGYADQGVDTSVKYVDQGVNTVGIEAIEKYYDKIVEILKFEKSKGDDDHYDKHSVHRWYVYRASERIGELLNIDADHVFAIINGAIRNCVTSGRMRGPLIDDDDDIERVAELLCRQYGFYDLFPQYKPFRNTCSNHRWDFSDRQYKYFPLACKYPCVISKYLRL
jgi:hypothetical protein